MSDYIVFKRKTFEKRVGWLDKHERFAARGVLVLTEEELDRIVRAATRPLEERVEKAFRAGLGETDMTEEEVAEFFVDWLEGRTYYG